MMMMILFTSAYNEYIKSLLSERGKNPYNEKNVLFSELMRIYSAKQLTTHKHILLSDGRKTKREFLQENFIICCEQKGIHET